MYLDVRESHKMLVGNAHCKRCPSRMNQREAQRKSNCRDNEDRLQSRTIRKQDLKLKKVSQKLEMQLWNRAENNGDQKNVGTRSRTKSRNGEGKLPTSRRKWRSHEHMDIADSEFSLGAGRRNPRYSAKRSGLVTVVRFRLCVSLRFQAKQMPKEGKCRQRR